MNSWTSILLPFLRFHGGLSPYLPLENVLYTELRGKLSKVTSNK